MTLIQTDVTSEQHNGGLNNTKSASERSLSSILIMQGLGGQLRESDDPLNLLDPATSRAMHRTAAGQAPAEQGPDFPTEGGKLVIREEEHVGR